MKWEDLLLMFTGIGFSVAMIPTLLKKVYPTRASCVITSTLLLGNCIALGSLGLWLACVSTVITLLVWSVMAVWRR